MVHILLTSGLRSQSSKSRMYSWHWSRRRTAFFSKCCAMYGTSPRICTSWQASMRRNKTSGASCGEYNIILNKEGCWCGASVCCCDLIVDSGSSETVNALSMLTLRQLNTTCRIFIRLVQTTDDRGRMTDDGRQTTTHFFKSLLLYEVDFSSVTNKNFDENSHCQTKSLLFIAAASTSSLPNRSPSISSKSRKSAALPRGLGSS